MVFNLVLWSYGLLEMSGDRRSLSVKKLVFNPGMIGLAAGLVVFLLPFPLPEVFAVPIRGPFRPEHASAHAGDRLLSGPNRSEAGPAG